MERRRFPSPKPWRFLVALVQLLACLPSGILPVRVDVHHVALAVAARLAFQPKSTRWQLPVQQKAGLALVLLLTGKPLDEPGGEVQPCPLLGLQAAAELALAVERLLPLRIIQAWVLHQAWPSLVLMVAWVPRGLIRPLEALQRLPSALKLPPSPLCNDVQLVEPKIQTMG